MTTKFITLTHHNILDKGQKFDVAIKHIALLVPQIVDGENAGTCIIFGLTKQVVVQETKEEIRTLIRREEKKYE